MVSPSILRAAQHDNTNDDERTALIRFSFAAAIASDGLSSYGTSSRQQQEQENLRPSASSSNADTQESTEESTSGNPVSGNEGGSPDTGTSQDDDSAIGDAPERSGTIGTLTRRLRCLFSTITWPIVPLGTIVALALLWVLYAASSMDLRRTCSHPLHLYAIVSLGLVSYTPHHGNVRSRLFQYSRERDGPIRPARVRMYDQFFHTICLLYVYTGVTLIQTCHDDAVTAENLADLLAKYSVESVPPDTPMNTCAATCPNLYQALSVYVATLEMFTFALILPLLFLPCIYLWFLRRATAEAEAFAQLQDRLQEEEALLSNGGITSGEILDGLENVKLVARPLNDGSGESQLWLLPESPTSSWTGTRTEAKECCICMNEFGVQNEEGGGDVESGFRVYGERSTADDSVPECDSSSTSDSTDLKQASIIRTRCGHVFHKEVSTVPRFGIANDTIVIYNHRNLRCLFFRFSLESQCLAGWVGGRWSTNPQNQSNDDGTQQPDRRRRRARQTCCPLCREDLRPRPPGPSSST